MSPLAIALCAAAAVVLAHIGLFWWFLCRKGGKGEDHKSSDDP
jgi:hypothetical protein